MQAPPCAGPFRRRFLLPLSCCLVLTLGCHALRLAPSAPERLDKPEKEAVLAPPGKRSLRISQYVFLSDFELKRDLPLFRELMDLREQVYKELQLPSANTVVQVYLFEDRERYERFMHAKYPELPKRRAFFVAQPRTVGGTEDLLVYTFWGDRVREDLRHELTHALLHSVLRDVPLWLDEGLAEYYEVPPDQQGVNYQHLDQICRAPGKTFHPDLARLEGLSQVQQMTPAEYRESWAWVHLMLRDKPEAKAVLVNYLQQLRTTPNPGSMQARLTPIFADLEQTLNQHLAHFDGNANHPSTEDTEIRHTEKKLE
jgi:hypothetical protein